MDRHFPFAAPVPGHMPALALHRFAEEHGIIPSGGDGSAPLDAEARRALETRFADPALSASLAPELYVLMERLRAEFQDRSSPVRALQLLEKLRDTLSHLDPEKLTPAQRRQVKGELAAIQAQAAVLLGDADLAPAARGGALSRLLGGKG